MADAPTLLGSLRAGARAVIEAIPLEDGLRDDLFALCLIPGEEIEVVQVLPLGGPVLISARGGLYALGRAVADRVRVRS